MIFLIRVELRSELLWLFGLNWLCGSAHGRAGLLVHERRPTDCCVKLWSLWAMVEGFISTCFRIRDD